LDVITAYREVGTYRGAADMCGVTHKTAKRIVEADQAAAVRVARRRNYESVRALVSAKVEGTRGKISAKRLLPEAVASGYSGSARNFRRLVAQEKNRFRQRQAIAGSRRPAVWSPGEHLVIDWGVMNGLHVLCAVLAFSRVRFVRFADDERAETTLAMLAECFQTLGGVPKVVLADRMGCLKGGVVANKVVPTGEYVRFAGHYGFRPDFCEAADPESKGIVENLVGYAKVDLMIPGVDLSGEPFADMAAANAAASGWCLEVNSAVHSEICAVPVERLAVERELLSPLPSLRASIGRTLSRKVDRLSCVRFGSARYSVPVRFIGAQVRLHVEADRSLAIIAGSGEGEMVAEHLLVAPGEVSIMDVHYGGPRPAPRRAVRPRTVAEKAFCALGPTAEAFITGAAAAGNTRLGPELAELNTLAAAHGQDVFLDALSRAVAFSRWRAADIRSILHAGTGTPQPVTAGDALVLELPVVPTRPLSDYAIGEQS